MDVSLLPLSCALTNCWMTNGSSTTLMAATTTTMTMMAVTMMTTMATMTTVTIGLFLSSFLRIRL